MFLDLIHALYSDISTVLSLQAASHPLALSQLMNCQFIATTPAVSP